MTRSISSKELRSMYVDFFAEKGHVPIPSASLVPADDPTVLFTTAGMHPLVPYLLGAPHPAGRRLVGVQKCVRTGDIEVIGDDTHLTFFEMLGHWSLGDYSRSDAIRFSFEFLTHARWLGLALERIGVTCFAGDAAVPRDLEAAATWQSLGVPAARCVFLGREDNWWGPAGTTGPCGPDTEIFYWVGREPAPRDFDPKDARWVELWNNVFMSHSKSESGQLEALPKLNVDTGMGLERSLVALNELSSVFETDPVAPLFHELSAMVTTAGGHERDLRLMTDHLRAGCLMLGAGVAPSNKDRGYVVRRLLRRCLWSARRLSLPCDWYRRGAACVAGMLGETYPELVQESDFIVSNLEQEHSKFERAVQQGLRALDGLTTLNGAVAFDLFQTRGIPFEVTRELARTLGQEIDPRDYESAFERHRALSRSTSSGTFASGLADYSPEIVRYHTLTHLLHAALRKVLGAHVIQRGSNITRERLRFDFSHDRKLLPDELSRVEALIADWLARDLVVDHAIMAEPEARALGALGAFGEKYAPKVTVYTIRDRAANEVISREFCAGPHVTCARAELQGQLRIVREQAISGGVRRIKAVLES